MQSRDRSCARILREGLRIAMHPEKYEFETDGKGGKGRKLFSLFMSNSGLSSVDPSEDEAVFFAFDEVFSAHFSQFSAERAAVNA